MGLPVAVAGKGGSGKSVIAGTLARILARRGHRVLALDSDTVPGLALSLGAQVPEVPPLLAAMERGPDKRWRFVHGVGPVRAVQRFSTPAPDGVRLLQIGKTGKEGQAPFMAATQAFYRTIHGLAAARAFDEWVVLGDLPAGPRQLAFDWAPYARHVLLVAEPTRQSLMTARRVQGIVKGTRADVPLLLVANKVRDAGDARRISTFLDLPLVASVPVDEDVVISERLGVAVIDHAPESPAVRAVERLAVALEGHAST